MANDLPHIEDPGEFPEQDPASGPKAAADKGLQRSPAVWAAVAVLVLGLSVIAGLYWNRSMRVRGVAVHGTHFSDPAAVARAMAVPKGVKPDSLDYLALIRRASKVTYVKTVELSVDHGGELNVQVKERQPIALLVNGADKIYVDEDGIRLPVLPGKAMDVPVLYGFKARPKSDTLQSEAFRRVSDFLLRARNNPVAWATISEVAYTPDEGVVALSHENGVKLLFGKADYQRRLKYWQAFYSEVVRQKGIDRMRTVDLRFKGQIVTREDRS